METVSPAPVLARARPDDEEALSALARKAYEHYIPILKAVPLPMTADYGAMIRDHETWTLRSGSHLVGSLVLIHEEDHLMIESVAVAPDTQGNGFGRQLLAFAEERAQAEGYADLRLYTNALMTENRAWYRRIGFIETGEEQRGDKRVVHMSKAIRSVPS